MAAAAACAVVEEKVFVPPPIDVRGGMSVTEEEKEQGGGRGGRGGARKPKRARAAIAQATFLPNTEINCKEDPTLEWDNIPMGDDAKKHVDELASAMKKIRALNSKEDDALMSFQGLGTGVDSVVDPPQPLKDDENCWFTRYMQEKAHEDVKNGNLASSSIFGPLPSPAPTPLLISSPASLPLLLSPPPPLLLPPTPNEEA
ncbi:unnamed protein product [Rotaria magnacalcarata]|uniref:Uncharacterized protein n=1 Tax=Rotaria magnacalcarata TaxID=392030 RepID=A0A816CUI5_9BILA|nr:unnamed protein product [Rotaria magnacalcarata]CAF4918752.1 unnamed protein product [Rotaria magnacalcarata]